MKTPVPVRIVPGAVIRLLINPAHHRLGISLVVNCIQFPQNCVHLRLQRLVTGHAGFDGHVVNILVVFTDILHCKVHKIPQALKLRLIKALLGCRIGQTVLLGVSPVKTLHCFLQLLLCLVKCFLQTPEILIDRHFSSFIRFFLTSFPIGHHSSPPWPSLPSPGSFFGNISEISAAPASSCFCSNSISFSGSSTHG